VVVNAIISVMWSLAEQGQQQEAGQGPGQEAGLGQQEWQVPVFQVASSRCNPLQQRLLVEAVHRFFLEHPLKDRHGAAIAVQEPLWFPGVQQFVGHMEAQLHHHQQQVQQQQAQQQQQQQVGGGGEARRARRQLAVAEQALQQMAGMAALYAPYTLHKCSFSSSNVQRLWGSLSLEEQRVFDFDLTSLDWQQYLQQVHIPGLLHYVLKRETPG
jgi:fatty acyl-CoA reductase